MTNVNNKNQLTNQDKRAEDRYENEGGENQAFNKDHPLDKERGCVRPEKPQNSPNKRVNSYCSGLDEDEDERKYSFLDFSNFNKKGNGKFPREDKNAPRGR